MATESDATGSESASESEAEDATSTEPAFEAIIDAETMAEFVGTLTPLVNEAKFHLNPDGLQSMAVDPANVGMSRVTLDVAVFESYSADGGVIGLNLDRFADVLDFGHSGDLAHLRLDQETRKLHIDIGGLDYTLALIDPDSIRPEPDLPDLDLPNEIVLEGRDLSRAVDAAEMVSDHITIEADASEETLVLRAEGDTDDASLTLGTEELVMSSIGDSAKSLFSLDYLDDMEKPIDAQTEVRMVVGEEFPVKMHFDIAEGQGSVTYMLAPRIQND
jgi:proliferating cell nuclear antigen